MTSPRTAETEAAVAEFYRHLGERIADARAMQGLTQRGLAAAVGLSRSSIGNFESGTQGLAVHMLAAIAQALGTDIPALLGTGQLPTRADGLPTATRDRIAIADAARTARRIASRAADLADTLAGLGSHSADNEPT